MQNRLKEITFPTQNKNRFLLDNFYFLQNSTTTISKENTKLLAEMLKMFGEMPQKDKISDLYRKANADCPEFLTHLTYSTPLCVNFQVLDNWNQLQTIKLLIDTGASSCVMYYETLQSLGLAHNIDRGRKGTVMGAGGKAQCYGVMPYMEVTYEGYCFPMSAIVTGTHGITKFAGILGINFFKTYNASIDFTNNTLTLNNVLQIPFTLNQ